MTHQIENLKIESSNLEGIFVQCGSESVIFTSDLSVLPTKYQKFLLADDASIFAKGKCLLVNCSRLQGGLNTFSSYPMKLLKLKLPSATLANNNYVVEMTGVQINWLDRMRSFELIFNKHLLPKIMYRVSKNATNTLNICTFSLIGI